MNYLTPQGVAKLIFDQPLLYGARLVFLGGWPFAETLRLLDSQETDVILDVGCGPGYFADKIKYRSYFGFDHDRKAIQMAIRKNIPNTQFLLQDVQNFDFNQVKPTKAILSGVIHHLNDHDATQLLNAIARTISGWIVTEDPVYSRYHFLNNLLCRLDRGQFVRTEDEMSKLIEKTNLLIKEKVSFFSNSKISKHLAFRLTPAR